MSAESFVLFPRDHEAGQPGVDPASWYQVGRHHRGSPWVVFGACRDEAHAVRLASAAPHANEETLATRLGASVLAGLLEMSPDDVLRLNRGPA